MTIISTNTTVSFLITYRKKSNFLFAIGILFLLLLSLGFYSAGAQEAKMILSSIPPDWNGKTVCDPGQGYDVTLINAPALGYIGKGIKESSYNYTWEQKMDEGAWAVVLSGKAKSFIPSYNPPVLFHPKPGGSPIKYSWRLKVTDLANGNQTGESGVYTLNLASPIVVSYKLSSSKSSKNKTTINLTVKGGLSDYTYSWSVADRKSTLPIAQANVKDPERLDHGSYQVEVSDGCSKVIKSINTLVSDTDENSKSSN